MFWFGRNYVGFTVLYKNLRFSVNLYLKTWCWRLCGVVVSYLCRMLRLWRFLIMLFWVCQKLRHHPQGLKVLFYLKFMIFGQYTAVFESMTLEMLHCTFVIFFTGWLYDIVMLDNALWVPQTSDGVTLGGAFYTKIQNFWSIYRFLFNRDLEMLNCTCVKSLLGS